MANKPNDDVMLRARVKLVLGANAKAAFFGCLALRLKFVVAPWIDTMGVDGTHLFYNPAFAAELSEEERIGVLVHEIMHCALRHFTRRGTRNHELFNVANDLAINDIIDDSGFKLPAKALRPGKRPLGQWPKEIADCIANMQRGRTSEEYYQELEKFLKPSQSNGQGQPGNGQSGNGQADPGDGSTEAQRGQAKDVGNCGSIIDPQKLTKADTQQAEQEWQIAATQAAQIAKQRAKNRGDMPAHLQRMFDELTAPPKVDWRHILRQFITAKLNDDYSWARPNRRHIAEGLFLPSMDSLGLARIMIALDTSGSIGDAELRQFLAEVQSIVEIKPVKLVIVYHCQNVYQIQEWQPSDGPLEPLKTKSGGTSHKDVWQKIEEQDEAPVAMICLTDCETDFGEEPGVPVLWVSTGRTEVPFGEVVKLDHSVEEARG